MVALWIAAWATPAPADGPPALPETTAASMLVDELLGEMTRLSSLERTSSGPRQHASRASITLRLLAVDLLTRGELAGAAGSGSIMLGWRLANGRADADAWLDAWVARYDALARPGAAPLFIDAARFAVASSLIDRFGATSSARSDALRAAPPERAAEVLAEQLLPFATAVSILEGRPQASHWIERPGPPPAPPRDPVGALAERLDAADLDPPARAAGETIVDVLRRGSSFIEYRARVERSAALVEDAVTLADRSVHRPWLRGDDWRFLAESATAAMVAFAAGNAPDAAAEDLEGVSWLRSLVDRLGQMSEGDEDVRRELLAFGRTARRHDREIIDGVDRALDALLALGRIEIAADGTSIAGAARRHASEVERGWRRLRTIATRLAKDARSVRAEDVGGVAAALESRLEDARRLARLPAALEAASSIEPRSATTFALRARRLAERLFDPDRRGDAAAALDALVLRLDEVHPFPGESRLRSGDPDAQILTGGQHQELALAYTARRAEWIASWASESGQDAADAWMDRLTILDAILEESRPLARGADPALLNRWAAVEFAPPLLERRLAGRTARLRLAALAASSGDGEGLDRHLAALADDRALTSWLLSTAVALETDLASLPDGALGLAGRCCVLPGDATGAASRERLAHLSRYAAELYEAELADDPALVGALRSYLAGLIAAEAPREATRPAVPEDAGQ